MFSESKCSDHDGFSRLLPPDYQPERTPDDVARCNNGVFSDNTDFSATCTENDGVADWLAQFGECNDGRVILMSIEADSGDHDGFRGLLPTEYQPAATPADVARCSNGLFSDNTDLSTTCSDNGGVAEWLATYGRCKDGTDIVMGPDASCSDHDGFGELLPPDYTSQTSTTAAPVTVVPTPPSTDVTTTQPIPGSVAAIDVLAFITVENEHQDGYDRDRFGYPADLDADGCDTRADVLTAESAQPPQVDPSGCTVVAGEWYSLYDNTTWASPEAVTIDHVVALKEA